MHQIRVHAAASRHPIIGDPKYGDSKKDKAFRSSRMMLHASALSVIAKDAGAIEFASLNVEAPLPPDFMALVERTRAAT
jgi:23S rRNA pseudouridine955/2504/2580 synthase